MFSQLSLLFLFGFLSCHSCNLNLLSPQLSLLFLSCLSCSLSCLSCYLSCLCCSLSCLLPGLPAILALDPILPRSSPIQGKKRHLLPFFSLLQNQLRCCYSQPPLLEPLLSLSLVLSDRGFLLLPNTHTESPAAGTLVTKPVFSVFCNSRHSLHHNHSQIHCCGRP
jgi:hypothetical protein